MEEARQLFLEGKKAFQLQQYDRAQKAFVQLVKNQPKFADVYNMLGVIYHNFGQFSDAVTAFEKAVKINPNYTEALLNLSVLYSDLGEYKKARKLYAKVQSNSKSPKGNKMNPFIQAKLANRHAEVGDMYDGVGFYKEAIEEYKKALQLAPNFHDIRCKLAVCLRELKKYADATSELNQVLKSQSKYHYAKVQRGVTQYAAGKPKEALKDWNEVIKADPNNETAKMYLRLAKAA